MPLKTYKTPTQYLGYGLWLVDMMNDRPPYAMVKKRGHVTDDFGNLVRSNAQTLIITLQGSNH